MRVILWVTLIILVSCVGAKRNYRMARNAFRQKQSTCQTMCELQSDTQICISNCISPVCYQKYFVEYELEEGEIDTKEILFQACAIEELRTDST